MRRGRAAGDERTRGAACAEAGDPLPAASPERRDPARRAGDGPGGEVDSEVVLGEAAAEGNRRLDLAAADGPVRVERREDRTGTVRRVAVHGERRAGGRLAGGRELVGEQVERHARVARVAWRDGGRGNELDVGVDREVALVPVEAVGARLAVSYTHLTL